MEKHKQDKESGQNAHFRGSEKRETRFPSYGYPYTKKEEKYEEKRN